MTAPNPPVSAFDEAKSRLRTPLTSTAFGGGPGMETALREANLTIQRHQDNLTDDEFAAAFVNQPSIAGPPGDIATRGMMAFFGDTFEERKSVFQSRKPAGDLLQVPSTEIVLYRNEPDQPYRKLDPGFMDSMAQTGRGKELLADITEMAGQDVLNIGGEALFMYLLRQLPGAGTAMVQAAKIGARNRMIRAAQKSKDFLTRPGSGDVVVRLPAGGAAGEVVQQGAQTIAGTQKETLGEQASRVGTEAGISMLGGAAGSLIGGTINVARGRGVFRMTPEGRQATVAAGRLQKQRPDLEIEPPLPIQVVDAPAIKLLGSQAAALLPRIPRAIRKAQERLNKAFQKLSSPKERNALIREFTASVQSYSDDVVSLVRHGMRGNGKTSREALVTMREVVNDWWRTTGDQVDAMYLAARNIEDPRLSIADPVQEGAESLLETVARIKRGVVGVGKTVEKEADTGILDAAGRPIKQITEEQTSVQTRNLNKKLTKEMDRLEALDPSLPIEERFDSPVEVLREIRKNLYDLSLPGPEGARQPNILAGQLKRKIDEVLENPLNDRPEFVRAWKAANASASKRFRSREQTRVIEVLNSEEPGKLMETLIRPGAFDSLVAVSKAGGRKAIDQARLAFGHRLLGELRSGKSLSSFLDSFDEPTLRMLMPPTAEGRKAVRDAAKLMDVMLNSGVPKAIARQSRVRAFLGDLIDQKNTLALDDLKAFVRVRGGKNGATGKSMRAALIDEIWRRSQTVVKGGFRKLEAKRLNATLDDFSERGLLDFLTFSELKVIRNIEVMQRAADSSAIDAGTSIQAASAIAGLRQLSGAALQTFVENYGVGRLMVTETGRKFLVGTAGGAPIQTTLFKLIGAASATLAHDSANFTDDDVERLIRSVSP